MRLLALFVFLFSDFKIVSHLHFVCNWQNKFWNSEPVIAHFLSNNGGNWDILIPRNSSKLHLAPFMRDVCHMRGFSKTGSGIVNLSLLVSRATKVGIQTYESNTIL